MTRQAVDGKFCILLTDKESSFITQILYDAHSETLRVTLRDSNVYGYKDVPIETFLEFSTSRSFGSFYNSNIKSKFKKQEIMAEEKNKPKKINKAKKERRFIECDINLSKINKEFLYVAENGDKYLKMRMVMQPDGEVDKYGRLAFFAQKVPKEFQADDVQGAILGNAEELEWDNNSAEVPVRTVKPDDGYDDLPF